MYDPNVVATARAELTLSDEGSRRTVSLYSAEGLSLVAALWLKLSAEFRLMYEPTWMGIPIIQLPSDIVAMQELIWKVRPDVIVECGIAHGGAAILYASMCELIGKGRVIGVDVEIRQYNRVAIEGHPMSGRIELIEGSSVAPATVDDVRRRIVGARTVVVVLDSNHSYEHVRQELELYRSVVTPGSYLVAMDGLQAHVWDVPRGNSDWREDNPLRAIHEFVEAHREFQIDPRFTRMHLTSSPDGFLRRLTPEELSR